MPAPATPQADANWSIRPQFTPTYAFSARWQIRASSRGGIAAGSAASAQAEASSRAADDERPEARGSDEARTPRKPRVAMPASASAHAVAGDVGGQAAGAWADRVEVERRALVGGVAHQLDPAVVGGDERDPDLEVDRRRQDEAQVVVGVLADQVDPARRAGDADLPRIQRGGRLQLDEPIAEPPRVELRGVGDGRVGPSPGIRSRASATGGAHARTSSVGTTTNPGCSSRAATGTARSRAAFSSGSVSLMNRRVAVSTEARTFVRRSERWGG